MVVGKVCCASIEENAEDTAILRSHLQTLRDLNAGHAKERRRIARSTHDHSETTALLRRTQRSIDDRSRMMTTISITNPGPIAQYAPGLKITEQPHTFYQEGASKVKARFVHLGRKEEASVGKGDRVSRPGRGPEGRPNFLVDAATSSAHLFCRLPDSPPRVLATHEKCYQLDTKSHQAKAGLLDARTLRGHTSGLARCSSEPAGRDISSIFARTL